MSATPAVNASPTFAGLYGLFPDPTGVPASVGLTAAALPQPYAALLVHHHHMTVTVERHHGEPVDVTVLETLHDGDEYARKILLTTRHSRRVVQFGIVRIDLSKLVPAVRDRIVEGKTPLGRVLIEHDVLRTVRPTGFVAVMPNAELAGWFGLSGDETCYGRLGVITADGVPAVEVLEVLVPEVGAGSVRG